jgi:hypothetical protein
MNEDHKMSLTFGVIGSGYIFQKHKQAIERIGGKIINIYDPILTNLQRPEDLFVYEFDWLVICSPSFTHYNYLKMGLKYDKNIICEKPAWLPYQPPIDDNRINIVLQYRYLENLPQETVKIKMVRNEKYLNSDKGNFKITGGIWYNLFIHGLDLALELNVDFEGMISTEGKQVRSIGNFDLNSIDMDNLYWEMYKKIIFENKGIKPQDVMFLHWWLEHHSNIYGYGKEMLNKRIYLSKHF